MGSLSRRHFLYLAAASVVSSLPLLKPILRNNEDEVAWKLPSEISIEKEKPFELGKHLPAGIEPSQIKRFFLVDTHHTLPKGISLSEDGVLSLDAEHDEMVYMSNVQFGFEFKV